MVHRGSAGQRLHIVRLRSRNIVRLELRRKALEVVRVLHQVIVLEYLEAKSFTAFVLFQISVDRVNFRNELRLLVILHQGKARYLEELLNLYVDVGQLP